MGRSAGGALAAAVSNGGGLGLLGGGTGDRGWLDRELPLVPAIADLASPTPVLAAQAADALTGAGGHYGN